MSGLLPGQTIAGDYVSQDSSQTQRPQSQCTQPQRTPKPARQYGCDSQGAKQGQRLTPLPPPKQYALPPPSQSQLQNHPLKTLPHSEQRYYDTSRDQQQKAFQNQQRIASASASSLSSQQQYDQEHHPHQLQQEHHPQQQHRHSHPHYRSRHYEQERF